MDRRNMSTIHLLDQPQKARLLRQDEGMDEHLLQPRLHIVRRVVGKRHHRDLFCEICHSSRLFAAQKSDAGNHGKRLSCSRACLNQDMRICRCMFDLILLRIEERNRRQLL